MVSRRELLAGGVMGSFVSQDQETMQAARLISEKIEKLEAQLRQLGDGSALPSVTVSKLREVMMTFLRAHQKFPDYCEVGVGVFFDIFDWHVKNQQQLSMGRQPDGRYTMQFMFTRLQLRADAEPGFVGYPYDLR